RVTGQMPAAFKPESVGTKVHIIPYILVVGLIFVLCGSLLLFSGNSPHSLMEKGKYSEALKLLKEKEKIGQLSDSDLEDLNNAYVLIAGQYAQAGKYKSAYSVLQQVSPKSKQGQRAKELMKQYKRLSR